MSKIIIHGAKPLSGTLSVQGAKNAVLPILAATVLNGGENIIRHCPRLRDVEATVEILRHLGCLVRWEGDVLYVNSAHIHRSDIPDHLMREMRSSVIFLGAIAARCGEAHISMPGGCDIGSRPIDLHLRALREMGMVVSEEAEYISAKAKDLRAKTLRLAFPSVGATENIMLAASAVLDETVIENAAKEPEIVDLADYLKKIGVTVQGAGTDVIRMRGTKEFQNATHTVMPDRIVTATYLCASVITKSPLTVKDTNANHLRAVLEVLRLAGAETIIGDGWIHITPPETIRAVKRIETRPYPGFPTDAQSLFLSLFCLSDGESVMEETIFENRFKTVPYLTAMGADITLNSNTATVRGVPSLHGAEVKAPDLRGGASLVLAALAAEGETVIENAVHIQRGYEDICKVLSAVGADIKGLE